VHAAGDKLPPGIGSGGPPPGGDVSGGAGAGFGSSADLGISPSTPCLEYLACARACGATQTCLDSCGAQNASGQMQADAAASCLYAACSSAGLCAQMSDPSCTQCLDQGFAGIAGQPCSGAGCDPAQCSSQIAACNARALPDMATPLDGCHGFASCLGNCRTASNLTACEMSCSAHATQMAMTLANGAFQCAAAWCESASSMHCASGLTDPPGSPTGICKACLNDVLADMLGTACVLGTAGDCRAAMCHSQVASCKADLP
jgi:hypothetical protein